MTKPRFKDFVKLCEQLEKTSSNTKLRDKLASYLSDLDPETVKQSSYFILGNIGPKYEDIDMGFGDKTVIKVLSRAFDADEKKVKKLFSKKGDLGDVAEELSGRKRSSLTIQEVQKSLWKIKKTTGEGSEGKRAGLLAGLLGDASAKEAKYLTRIVLQKTRLGVGEKTILEAYAKAFASLDDKEEIEHKFNVCTDIGRLGESLAKNGMGGIKRFSIKQGRPVEAMLAQRVDKVSEILEKIEGDRIAAEEKYDGERVQVHKDGKEITLFSRRLEDITGQYPDIVEGIKKSIKSRKAVLDGEIVAIEDGKAGSFQKLMQRRRKYDVEEYAEKVPAALFLFDILSLNGRSKLKKPYPERRKLLEKQIKGKKGKRIEGGKIKRKKEEKDGSDRTIRLAGRKVSNDFDEIKEFFEQAIDKGLEGIIVKDTSKKSLYRPGKRGWLWIKWKKEYAEGMQESFDTVVVGSYYGKGRRKGGFGALLCAVRNEKEDRYDTFTKVGAGFTDKDIKQIGKRLDRLSVKERPKNVKIKRQMHPDRYYRPKLVMEIIGAEITRSPSHTAGEKKRGKEKGKGLALRFPRFQRLRPDKSAEQATTVKEVKQIR